MLGPPCSGGPEQPHIGRFVVLGRHACVFQPGNINHADPLTPEEFIDKLLVNKCELRLPLDYHSLRFAAFGSHICMIGAVSSHGTAQGTWPSYTESFS